MLLKYITASAVNATVPTRHATLDTEFWNKFEYKLSHCKHNENKQAQLVSNLHDTVHRICAPTVPVHSSRTTWWQQPDVLCFVPSNVHTNCIMSEQRASFFVMHEPSSHSRIHIIVDLSKLSMATAFSVTSKASYHNIVDGLRLWSTLPHSIDSIYVICPVDIRSKWVLEFIVSRILTRKLQDRLSVYKSFEEVLKNIK